MNDYRYPSPVGAATNAQVGVGSGYLSQAFAWMFAGLLLTGVVSFLVQTSAQVQSFARTAYLPAILVELALVWGISLGIRRLGALAALGLFFVYAALNGLVLGLIFTVYTVPSIATAFFSAAAMFGGAAVFGAVTKRSLAGLGGILTMVLFGLLGALIVNLFLGSSTLSIVISIAGVVLFTILTAYHVQQIQSGQLALATGSPEKAAVLGALFLYINFVNIFLFLLRLFGSRR